MAGRDGTSADNKDYKMVPATDGKGNPVLDGKGNPVMTKKYGRKSEKKASATTPSTRSTPAASKPKDKPAAKRDIASMASDAIDRSAPTRPKARPGTTRPKARPNSDTATSASAPKVTTGRLPSSGRPSGPKGPSPLATSEASGPRGDKPFAGTKPTRAEWDDMTVAERVRWGVILPPSSKTSDSQGSSSKAGTTAGRRERRAARRSESGYAKGGMVKANCGASMKPTQKSTRKK